VSTITERAASAYDPDYDNCAGTPGCGNERTFFSHFGMKMTACPRCYENVFGAAPDPALVFKIAAEHIPGAGAAS
jgi:hypothetical protein